MANRFADRAKQVEAQNSSVIESKQTVTQVRPKVQIQESSSYMTIKVKTSSHEKALVLKTMLKKPITDIFEEALELYIQETTNTKQQMLIEQLGEK